MKKINILIVMIFAFSIANAQSSSEKATTQTKGDPLVNGIPYSQYKAQVLAKQQQIQRAATANTKPVEVKAVDTQGTSLEVRPVTTSVENKAATSGPSSTDAKPIAAPANEEKKVSTDKNTKTE